MDPNMGTRVLKFIPNTPALVAWGLKLTTCHLSDLINSRTKGNILNQQALLSAYEQGFLLKYYIIGALTRNSAGTLQDTLVIHLGRAIPLARRWRVRHKLLSIHLAQCTLARARARRAPSIQVECLMTPIHGQASTSRRTRPK